MLIGIISDTHGLLRQEVKDGLKGVDMIIHGGDIDCQSVLDQLKEISFAILEIRGKGDFEFRKMVVGNYQKETKIFCNGANKNHG